MLLHLSKVLSLMVFLTAGCSRYEKIKFEPNPYVGDYVNGGIVNADNDFISAYDIRFNQYGCFHESDFKRLAAILTAARIPKRYKNALQKELDKIDQKRKRAINHGR